MQINHNGDVVHIGRNEHISPHFQFKEFCHVRDPWPVERYDRLFRLCVILEAARRHIDCRLKVTSGYRGPARNAQTPGAAANSQHMYARAVDFRALTPEDITGQNERTEAAHAYLAKNADALSVGALGWYPVGPGRAQARIHVDIRGRTIGSQIKTWVK